MLDFTGGRKGLPPGGITANDATFDLRAEGLEVSTGTTTRWPGITLERAEGGWDLSAHWYVEVALYNPTRRPVKVSCRIDNAGATGREHCVTGSVTVAPEEPARLRVHMQSTPWLLSEPLELIGMRGFPQHQNTFDPAHVERLLFFTSDPAEPFRFQIRRIRACGRPIPLEASRFLPFVDPFGQFQHADWPGKTHSLDELKTRNENEEKRDLAAHPGPSDRSRYGGWLKGKRLKGSGFFRVEKVDGRWWLVDPEGHLFWSQGIDCVHARGTTPITDREHYFTDLPGPNDLLAQCFGIADWAPHGYLKGRGTYRTYDFYKANLIRKFGADYAPAFSERTQRRLKSWGMNTIGNWSDQELCLMNRTPFTQSLYFQAPVIEGSSGHWRKFPDPFDPAFRKNLRQRAQYIGKKLKDNPWFIGYFAHNELSWGTEQSLALAALASPPEQAVKQAFVEELKTRYGEIAKLNAAWGTGHEDWQQLLVSTSAPDLIKAEQDLTAFNEKIADRYFRTIREEIKAADPNHMYLGCRFAWVNDQAARVAARHCDVITYNRYRYSVEDFTLPKGVDHPVLIGEFHFGALDRGVFHTGLRKARSQDDRAAKYTAYLESALRHPQVVGAHWFQYKDQVTTGRGDGENYQIGFVDICDRPYPEIIEAARKLAARMYALRER